MRPAHSAREIEKQPRIRDGEPAASMRPAHSAREIDRSGEPGGTRSTGFNEARAFSAGNHPKRTTLMTETPRFNEARAFSAGNPTRQPPPRQRCECFNEARAFSAGNLKQRETTVAQNFWLQ